MNCKSKIYSMALTVPNCRCMEITQIDSYDSPTLQKLAKQLHLLMSSDADHTQLEDQLLPAEEDNLACIDLKKRRAAVLICLFEGYEGELRVILTKRSTNLSSHPGEVALPGGKMEEGDADDCATALREAMEEIGLDPHIVHVVAKLDPFISQHQLRVVPVVGLLARIQDFKPILNSDEVDAIFDVPLEMFLKEENHRCEEKEWMKRKYVVHVFDFISEKGEFQIWGLTAGILIRAASIIYDISPSFNQKNLPDFQQLQKAMNNAT